MGIISVWPHQYYSQRNYISLSVSSGNILHPAPVLIYTTIRYLNFPDPVRERPSKIVFSRQIAASLPGAQKYQEAGGVNIFQYFTSCPCAYTTILHLNFLHPVRERRSKVLFNRQIAASLPGAQKYQEGGGGNIFFNILYPAPVLIPQSGIYIFPIRFAIGPAKFSLIGKSLLRYQARQRVAEIFFSKFCILPLCLYHNPSFKFSSSGPRAAQQNFLQ